MSLPSVKHHQHPRGQPASLIFLFLSFASVSMTTWWRKKMKALFLSASDIFLLSSWLVRWPSAQRCCGSCRSCCIIITHKRKKKRCGTRGKRGLAPSSSSPPPKEKNNLFKYSFFAVFLCPSLLALQVDYMGCALQEKHPRKKTKKKRGIYFLSFFFVGDVFIVFRIIIIRREGRRRAEGGFWHQQDRGSKRGPSQETVKKMHEGNRSCNKSADPFPATRGKCKTFLFSSATLKTLLNLTFKSRNRVMPTLAVTDPWCNRTGISIFYRLLPSKKKREKK